MIFFYYYDIFFQVIPPSGNTTFDVVFLGREEGPVENTLYIHTSAGSFRFLVKAQGTPNPYRLKPLVGVKLPLNSRYFNIVWFHDYFFYYSIIYVIILRFTFIFLATVQWSNYTIPIQNRFRCWKCIPRVAIFIWNSLMEQRKDLMPFGKFHHTKPKQLWKLTLWQGLKIIIQVWIFRIQWMILFIVGRSPSGYKERFCF